MAVMNTNTFQQAGAELGRMMTFCTGDDCTFKAELESADLILFRSRLAHFLSFQRFRCG